MAATAPDNDLLDIAGTDTTLSSTGLSNKYVLSYALRTTGWDKNEQVCAEHLNYWGHNHYEWIQYAHDRIDDVETSIDTINTTLDATSITAGNGITVANGGVGETTTIALTTPTTITTSTFNASTSTGHVHELDLSGRTITAGNGMSGGGTLDEDVTLTMGTPSTIGGGTSNSVSGTTHAHALTLDSNNIVVNTGTIYNGGTIPLPSGYTADECTWFVIPTYFTDDTTSDDIGAFTCSVNTSRVVSIKVEGISSSASYATYVIIGIH